MSPLTTQSVFCLMGPTASGKTALAVALRDYFPFEIISVDSAMVYRGMNIGTAKPSADVLKIAPHRLIDIRDPVEPYSAAQFCHDAKREIDDIRAHNRIPLLVGGTMLYFRALQQGLSVLPSANALVRTQIAAEGEQKGWPAVHARLMQIDEVAGKRIHPHDAQRISRALEVYELTGKNLTNWQQENAAVAADFQIINIAIAPTDRAILHNRIAQRFSDMLKEGFVAEVQDLFARGNLTLEMPSIRSVGYRQVWEYLTGHLTYAQMEEKGIIATRQLAKRQLTWLRQWPQLKWFDSEAPDLIDQVKHYINLE